MRRIHDSSSGAYQSTGGGRRAGQVLQVQNLRQRRLAESPVFVLLVGQTGTNQQMIIILNLSVECNKHNNEQPTINKFSRRDFQKQKLV